MNALVALGVKYPFVPVGLTIAIIVLAAGAAAYYDLKLRRKRKIWPLDWLSRLIFPYLLPALVIAAVVAYSFSTFVIIPYYPGSTELCHLHDPECRARIDPVGNQLYSMLGLALALVPSLLYLALVVWRRVLNRPYSVY